MRRNLTRAWVLWVLAALVFVLSFSFWFVMQAYEFRLLDELWEPQQAVSRILMYSEEQRHIHIWTTSTLDVLFPLAYGGLFVGLVWRFFGEAGRLLAIPGLAVIPIDLTEGAIQVLALSGQHDVVFHKIWVTPIKFGLFIIAAVFALAAIGAGINRRYLNQTAQR